jgi:hypothetical protein
VITIGNCRNRYSVRERSTDRDSRGERPDSFTEKFQVSGESPRDGSTVLAKDVGALRSIDTLRFCVRWRPGIKVGDQIVDVASGRKFYIHSATDVPGFYRQFLQLVVATEPSYGI